MSWLYVVYLASISCFVLKEVTCYQFKFMQSNLGVKFLERFKNKNVLEEKYEITICLGSSCFARGNRQVVDVVKKYINAHQLNAEVLLHGGLCEGTCEGGPIIKIDGKRYKQVTPESVIGILNKYFNLAVE